MTIKEVAEMFLKLMGYEPCNFGDMDEKTDDWCEEHCDKVNAVDCWEHAIEKGWIE